MTKNKFTYCPQDLPNAIDLRSQINQRAMERSEARIKSKVDELIVEVKSVSKTSCSLVVAKIEKDIIQKVAKVFKDKAYDCKISEYEKVGESLKYQRLSISW